MMWCLLALLLSVPAVISQTDACGLCVVERCPHPSNCLAGVVRDHCGCCMVCGEREGSRCFHEDVPDSGGLLPCGEGLKCRRRTDLAPGDLDEALCVCADPEPVCGSNGKTYDNICQLTVARYGLRNGLTVTSRGPCSEAPVILSRPENTSNYTGGRAAISCEVKGWPVPTVEWKVDRGNGRLIPLPTDSPRISVQSRGGPSNYEVTSWLQLLDVERDDSGSYYCVASNREGQASASAKLNVI
ncbi:insulin-like growth factor-binding protein-related protein 1 [Ornithodoros turicata]|uniref:insulin-like growth factor-binding protein-related protein 1 n=1 Tax=Ornithodoros turicata TaxID=34597 RepID=UPI003139E70F